MHRLLEQFEALLEMPADDRATALQYHQQQDPALAKALRAMLEADAQATHALSHDITQQNNSALGLNAELANGLASDLAMRINRSGSEFANYRIIKALGEGGMGTVWLAERKLLESTQLVALKFLHRAPNQQFLRHFNRERDSLSKLEHPAIARLIDAGQTPDGEPFIATEYIDGVPLREFAQPLNLPIRLQLIEQLCEAVDYAHRRLIVHRDIKPSNVLVDQNGKARLLDFGIAKSIDAAITQLTNDNPLSPAYAAPEQIDGGQISTATDVFALGLLLYELLTGTLPGKRGKIQGLALLSELTHETIEPPSAVLTSALLGSVTTEGTALNNWRKSLLGDLDQIVLKALKREPERRYANALALAEDLRRYGAGQTISARPDSLTYRWRKFIGRHRALVAISSVALVALLLALSMALIQANRAEQQARLAQAQTVSAQNQAQRADQIASFLLSLFEQSNPLQREAARALSPQQLLQDGIARANTELKDYPLEQAQLWLTLASAQLELNQLREAQQTLTMAIGSAQKARDPILEALVLSALSDAAARDLREDEARSKSDAALQLAQASKAPALALARIQSQRCFVLLKANELKLSIAACELAIGAFSEQLGAYHRETVRARNRLLTVLDAAREDGRLRIEVSNLIKDIETHYGAKDVRLASAFITRGALLSRTREYDAARTDFQSADKLLSALPERVRMHSDVLMRWANMERFADAPGQAEVLLERAEKLMVPEDFNSQGELAARRCELAMFTAQFAKAEPFCQRAWQIRSQHDNKTGIKWYSLSEWAAVRGALGHYAEAEADYELAIGELRKQIGPDGYQTAILLNNYADRAIWG